MIKVISIEEQNPFADASKCNDGGGYFQPLITFEYNGKIGTIDDVSCGDFGKRYYIDFGEKYYHFDSVSCNTREETNFTEEDDQFIDAFNEKFPEYRIYPKKARH